MMERLGKLPRRDALRMGRGALAGLLALGATGSPRAVAAAAGRGAVPSPATPTPPSTGAYYSGIYRNLFREAGYTEQDIHDKLGAAWDQLFDGDPSTQALYYLDPTSSDRAYIYAVDSDDVRTEGQSYGMMIAVQLDKKREFDRIWAWTKTYMQHTDPTDPWYGYFAWHCKPDGTVLDRGNASDGETWLITALFIASGRWGDGEGIYNYRAEAQAILDAIRSKEATAAATGVGDMFNPSNALVRFVAGTGANTWTDPSYVEPAYYELWARWASHDNDFWYRAAAAGRAFLHTTVNGTTGLMPDYANFDGTPRGSGTHSTYSYDARRTEMNIGMDYHWWANDPWQITENDRLQTFVSGQGVTTFGSEYTLDGTEIRPYHQAGHVAMIAAAGLAGSTTRVRDFVDELWAASIPSGFYRYYDGLLYLLGLLQVSGQFRIYALRTGGNPGGPGATTPELGSGERSRPNSSPSPWPSAVDDGRIVGEVRPTRGPQ